MHLGSALDLFSPIFIEHIFHIVVDTFPLSALPSAAVRLAIQNNFLLTQILFVLNQDHFLLGQDHLLVI